MSYSKRLPVFIRAALFGTLETWGRIHSFELTLTTPWCHRFDVVGTGVLSWVKSVFKEYEIPNSGCLYESAELNHAIRRGHRKVFWYLFDVYRCIDYDVPTLNALRTMIEAGHSDWFVEYIESFPRVIRKANYEQRGMLLEQALALQDFTAINAIITNELYIKELIAGEYLLLKYTTDQVPGMIIVQIGIGQEGSWRTDVHLVQRVYPVEMTLMVTSMISQIPLTYDPSLA